MAGFLYFHAPLESLCSGMSFISSADILSGTGKDAKGASHLIYQRVLVQSSFRFSRAAFSVPLLRIFKLLDSQQAAVSLNVAAAQSITQLELSHCFDKATRITSSGETR
jgi:hypothetical protein